MVTPYPRRNTFGWTARGVILGAAVLYGAGAAFFFVQESLARTPARAQDRALSELHHPEAVLGMFREHAGGVFPNELRPALSRALELAPSFYQGPLFYADFMAERREEPGGTRALFELAAARFPTNGRIKLAYAEWLLAARSDFDALAVLDTTDPLPLAEAQLQQALDHEPVLTARALSLLSQHRVPAAHWPDVVPKERSRDLVLALSRAGHDEQALQALRAYIAVTTGAQELAEAAGWAIAWGAPELALAATEGVRHDVSTGLRIRLTILEARAHWALGDPDAAHEVFAATLRDFESRRGFHHAGRVELLSAAGDELLRRGELVLAESFYREAIVEDARFVPAILGLARTYRGWNEHAAAVEAYENVLRLDHRHEAARRELETLLNSRR